MKKLVPWIFASAAVMLILPALDFPAVGLGVPVAERLVVQRNDHRPAFARAQRNLGKAF